MIEARYRNALAVSFALLVAITTLPAASGAQSPIEARSVAREAGEAPADSDVRDVVDSVAFTEEGVVRAALETAPSMDAARASVEAARAGARRALFGFVPDVQLGFRYTRLSDIQSGSIGEGIDPALVDAALNGVDDPEARILFGALFDGLTNASFPVLRNQYAFNASISYPITDLFLTILPSARAADAALDAQLAQVEVEQREIAQRAREAFFEHLRAVAAREVARETLEAAEAHLERLRALEQGGVASRADVLRVEASVAAARVGVAQADMGVAITEESIRVLTHGSNPEVGDGSAPPVPEGTLEELSERAERQRPEIVALRGLIDAQERRAQAMRGARYPRVGVQYNVVYANPNPRVFPQRARFTSYWEFNAVVSWSLSQTLDANAQAQQAEAEAARVQAEAARLRDGIRLEVASAYHSLLAAQAEVDAAQAQVAAADESYRVRWESLQAGVAATSDLIDARVERAQARVALLNAEVGVRLAESRLRNAISGAPSTN